MIKPTRTHLSDLRGATRIAVDATVGVTDLVERMHATIQRVPGIVGKAPQNPTRGITGLVYQSVRGVTRVVGRGLDAGLAPVIPLLPEGKTTPGREAFVAALNGVYGDYLARTGNPLAVAMSVRRDGRRFDPADAADDASVSKPNGRLLLLIHGLCLNDLHWTREGHNHGEALAKDHGYTSLYLHYNSGLHVSINGRDLAALLEDLVERWPHPVEELAIVGHSMGGLVARSACHYGASAGHSWPRRLSRLVCLGTPHHGAPAERGGNRFETLLEATPYAAALGRLGKLRSAGITDLRHGNLLDDDWQERDRFARAADLRRPVPLPDGVDCHFLAASLGRQGGDLKGSLLGDGIVPLASALGRHDDPARDLGLPAGRCWIAWESSHLDLLSSPEVYAQIRARLASGAA